ncbi:MAG TPA: Fic family protein [Sphingopyxis sp.]|nr:Fic family protein [Sphingopyxis sp.]HMP44097.1 Fic family protein [Sphingopyxis sp.]HMQ19113.1 Fic family protein [Sphingopyxis sp.]
MRPGSAYDSFADPYCYKGSFVLKNRAGLRDAALLEAFELEMTALRAEEPLPGGRFGSRHYRAIHRHLFQDVYRWAGRYRTVRTAKDGATFCYPEHIAEQMEILFARLISGPLSGGADRAAFVAAAARFIGELNAIHPFREGNGRTQLTFLFLVGERAGHPFDMAAIRPKRMLAAAIGSFYGDLSALEEEIGWICR